MCPWEDRAYSMGMERREGRKRHYRQYYECARNLGHSILFTSYDGMTVCFNFTQRLHVRDNLIGERISSDWIFLYVYYICVSYGDTNASMEV